MLLGGGVPGVAVGVVAAVVAGVVSGRVGVLGAALATVVVALSFGSSVVVLSRTAHLDPLFTFAVAMVTYVTKIGVLGVFLLLFSRASWLSPNAFALTAASVALVWTIGEVIAFTRVKPLLYTDKSGSAPSGASGDDQPAGVARA